jgi:hypothetical protein
VDQSQEVHVQWGGSSWMEMPWDPATMGEKSCICGMPATRRVRYGDGSRPVCTRQECARGASAACRGETELLQKVGDRL